MKSITIHDLLPNLTETDIIASKFKVYISDKIIISRHSMQLNQKDFSKFLGISKYKLEKWESGHYNFTIEDISLLINKCGIEIMIMWHNKNSLTNAKKNI